MNNRSVTWILTGLLVVGVTGLAAPGCGSSVAGEYKRICIDLCESGDDCEDYPGYLPVDRDDCIQKCDDDAIEFEDGVLDQCDDGVDINAAQLDECHEALTRLGKYCREDDESEKAEAELDVVDECTGETFYDCR